MTQAILDLLSTRRSVKAAAMTEPGPNAAQLDQILGIAARVPDHKKLEPWRFIVFEGDARSKFGDVIADACQAEDRMPPSQTRLETERARFLRAPTVVAVISRVVEMPGAPEIEQVLSAGAVCMNLVIAANALGYGTTWVTEWIAFSPRVHLALKLADNEKVAGFIYIGTAKERQADRDRPDLSKIVTRWQV